MALCATLGGSDLAVREESCSLSSGPVSVLCERGVKLLLAKRRDSPPRMRPWLCFHVIRCCAGSPAALPAHLQALSLPSLCFKSQSNGKLMFEFQVLLLNPGLQCRNIDGSAGPSPSSSPEVNEMGVHHLAWEK